MCKTVGFINFILFAYQQKNTKQRKKGSNEKNGFIREKN